MPVDLEKQILKVLSAMKPGDRPTTFGDLARRFGLSAGLISGYARQIVDKGLAMPSMVDVRGVPKLHGLLPLPQNAAAPALTVAEPEPASDMPEPKPSAPASPAADADVPPTVSA